MPSIVIASGQKIDRSESSYQTGWIEWDGFGSPRQVQYTRTGTPISLLLKDVFWVVNLKRNTEKGPYQTFKVSEEYKDADTGEVYVRQIEEVRRVDIPEEIMEDLEEYQNQIELDSMERTKLASKSEIVVNRPAFQYGVSTIITHPLPYRRRQVVVLKAERKPRTGRGFGPNKQPAKGSKAALAQRKKAHAAMAAGGK